MLRIYGWLFGLFNVIYFVLWVNTLGRWYFVESSFNDIFLIRKEDGTEVHKACAIKIFKTTLNEFKEREKYIRDDYRFKDKFSKQASASPLPQSLRVELKNTKSNHHIPTFLFAEADWVVGWERNA